MLGILRGGGAACEFPKLPSSYADFRAVYPRKCLTLSTEQYFSYLKEQMSILYSSRFILFYLTLHDGDIFIFTFRT